MRSNLQASKGSMYVDDLFFNLALSLLSSISWLSCLALLSWHLLTLLPWDLATDLLGNTLALLVRYTGTLLLGNVPALLVGRNVTLLNSN